jgi:Flp pilus assembly protein TadG
MNFGGKILLKISRLVAADDGGSLAELAIMVPFLILMLAAVSEIGRLFDNYTTLAKATRSASRYLSNHQLTDVETGRAINLVVCGKLACGLADTAIVNGFTSSNVCIETQGSPKVTTVTVRIPRVAGDCGSVDTAIGGTGGATPFNYRPIFNIGALLNTPSFSLALPIAPRTSMYYMID